MSDELVKSEFSLRKIHYLKLLPFVLPGIVFIGWYLYVSIHFNAFPFTQAHNIQDLYLRSWGIYFKKAYLQGNIIEFLGLGLYGITVIYSLIFVFIKGKQNKLWWSFVPYIILVSCFGSTVMMHWSGYLKGISILFGLLPIIMVDTKASDSDVKSIETYATNKAIIGIILVACVASGITGYYVFQKGPMEVRYLNKGIVSENHINPLTNFRCKLEIKDVQKKRYATNKILNTFTKDYDIYIINIKNLSGEIWSKNWNADGSCAVNLSYQWFREGDLTSVALDGNRANLTQDLPPGESIDMEMYVKVPSEPGRYVLRISLVQEGVSWFYFKPEASYIDVIYDVSKI